MLLYSTDKSSLYVRVWEFLGTIRYAAPEYLFGQSYTSNIDVYALGAIAFELFGEIKFFGNESQWARLIVEKSLTDKIQLDYPALQNLYGMDVTEFIKFIIERTLAKGGERTIDLVHLSEVIKHRLWEKPFYSIDGTLIQGEPKTLMLGEANEEARKDLSLVVEDLKRKLPEEVRAELRRALTETYHTAEAVYRWRWGWTSTLKQLGCFVGEGSEDMSGTPDWYILHESIITAYRFGYL